MLKMDIYIDNINELRDMCLALIVHTFFEDEHERSSFSKESKSYKDSNFTITQACKQNFPTIVCYDSVVTIVSRHLNS